VSTVVTDSYGRGAVVSGWRRSVIAGRRAVIIGSRACDVARRIINVRARARGVIIRGWGRSAVVGGRRGLDNVLGIVLCLPLPLS